MSRSSERLSGTNLERVSLTLGDGNLLKDSRALGSEERGAGSGLEGGLLAEPDGNLQRYSLDDEPPTPLEVLGIYSHYACLGWLNGLAVGSVFAYCYYVKAQEANVCNALPGFIQLSWTFKFVYGAVQDAFPILGQHRVPYIIGGWVGTIALGLVIVLFEPSLSVFHYACVAAACEFCMIAADVACDGLVVGLSAREPAATRGTLLSNAYSVRFAAGTLANLTVAVLYNGRRDGGDFRFSLSLSQLWLIGVAPALAALVTTLPNIREPPAPPRRTLGATFGEFYAVLSPCARSGMKLRPPPSLRRVLRGAAQAGAVARRARLLPHHVALGRDEQRAGAGRRRVGGLHAAAGGRRQHAELRAHHAHDPRAQALLPPRELAQAVRDRHRHDAGLRARVPAHRVRVPAARRLVLHLHRPARGRG